MTAFLKELSKLANINHVAKKPMFNPSTSLPLHFLPPTQRSPMTKSMSVRKFSQTEQNELFLNLFSLSMPSDSVPQCRTILLTPLLIGGTISI